MVSRGYVEDVGVGREFFFQLRDDDACFRETLGCDVALGQGEAFQTPVIAARKSSSQLGERGFTAAGSGLD